MSNTIREYNSIPHDGLDEGEVLSLTATCQGKYPSAIQFTIKNEYCILSKNQLLDLVKIIKKRIKCEKGYSATDSISECKLIEPKKEFECSKEISRK